MRILHVIPSAGGGGAERQLSYISGEMAKLGVEVHVAHMYGGPNFERLKRSGAVLHKISCRNNYDPAILFQLVSMIRDIKADLIQTWLPQMNIIGGIAAFMTSTPFILSERSGSLENRSGWKFWLNRLVAKKSAAIVSNSQDGRRYWETRNCSRLNTVIVNCLPFEEIELSGNLELGASYRDNGNEIVLYAGRYEDEKNLFMLLEALNLVLEKRKSALAVMCGAGSLSDELEDKRRGLSEGRRIKIFGYSENLWELMKVAKVFVSVSHYEGNPNTVLEAVACGCPVVVSGIEAHREFLDEDSAYIASPHSPVGIADCIMSALDDTAEAARRADCAKNKISGRTVEMVTIQYISLYNRVLRNE